MAVAHGAHSESHTGTTGNASAASFSWSHVHTGTPRGVVVFVLALAAGNPVTAVQYGGVQLDFIDTVSDAAGEPANVEVWFKGSGLSSGTQTINVDRTNDATVMYAAASTVDALTNTEIAPDIGKWADDGTLAEDTIDDGSPGTNSLRYAGGYSGTASPPSAGANSTLLNSIDFGANGFAMARETTAGQGVRSVGLTAASDDRAYILVAIREIVSAQSQAPRSMHQARMRRAA